LTRFVETLPIATTVGQGFAGGTSVTINGTRAYENSYTASSACFAAWQIPLLRKNKCRVWVNQKK
jgi:hypothetical protein